METRSHDASLHDLATLLDQLSPEQRPLLRSEINSLVQKWQPVVERPPAECGTDEKPVPPLLALSPSILTHILSHLEVKEIVRLCQVSRVFCYQQKSSHRPREQTAVERALRQKDLGLPPIDYQGCLNRWSRELSRLETLLVHQRLVAGRYRLEMLTTGHNNTQYQVRGDLELFSNGTVQGSAHQWRTGPTRGRPVSCFVRNGRWRSPRLETKQIVFDYRFCGSWGRYSVKVGNVTKTNGGVEVKLQGHFSFPEAPSQDGVVRSMTLKGPIFEQDQSSEDRFYMS